MSYAPAPFTGTALTITVAATASALTAVALPVGVDTTTVGNSIRIVNEGPNICFIAMGASNVAATLPTTGAGTTTCIPVLSGEDVILTRSPLVDKFISTICRASGTATLTVSIGEGT